MSSDFVALFQYVNNASRKIKYIKQDKGRKHKKYLIEEVASLLSFQIVRIQNI